MKSSNMMKFSILTLLGVLWLSPLSAQGRECVGDEWKCPEDQCIARSFVCDGDPDCLDTDGDEDPDLCETWNEGEDEETESDACDNWWGCADEEDEEYVAPSDDYEEYPEVTYNEDEDDERDYWSETDNETEDYIEPEPIIPENPERCALKKCKGGGKLMFPSGKYYMYNYVTKAVTEVHGASEQSSTLEIEANVQIQVLTACEMLLRVKNITVQTSTSDGSGQVIEDQAFAEAVKKNYLRFTYENGEVSWLCPRPDEDPRALNFKRAIVGLLQNTMTRLDLDHSAVETDIVGTCDVHYSVAGAEESRLMILKKRDMKSCTQRYQGTSTMQGVPYVFVGGANSLPVLESHSSCIQEIETHRIVGASCTETHKFVPFSSDKGGLVSTVTQRLEMTEFMAMPSIPMGAVYGRTDLRYDHHNHIHLEETDGENTESNEDMEAWKDRVTAILDDITQSKESDDGMTHEAPRMFHDLVKALRHLSFQHILDLAEERTWGLERPMFDDALPMVGTGASVGVMGELMSKGQVNNLIANGWLNSLAFMPRPDLDAVSAAAPLLEGDEDIHADAFLGVSALVNSYCRDHSDCSQHPPVERIMKSLHNFLSSDCIVEDVETRFKVLMALKGIGNAGLAVIDGMSETLSTCFRNHEAENEIRVAAINAFRRFPCSISRLPLQEMFLDTVEDSELRIAAYLGMMRCPDYETFKMVQAVLLYEEVNQVGTFVYTHLQNMKETSLPSRAEVQGFLSNQEIKSKFTPDVTKFSRNCEWSAFYDELNIGAGIDSNIVFSQESYIPRSVTFNLTTDLFGHSLNLLEVGARVEGITRYLEKMLGAVPQEDPVPMKNDKINALIKKVSRGDYYRNKEAELSLHMQTFGNEIYFRHYHGMDKILEATNKLNPLELVSRLNSGETLNIQKAFLPVESTIILPTTAGLPLNLTLTASIAIDMAASGNINVLQIMRRGNAEITGRLKPSVGMEVVGSMMIDGHAAQSGAQLVSSLHSSFVMDARLGLRGSELFLVDINMPRDKLEVLNFKSNVMLVHGSFHNNENNQKEMEPLQGVLADRMDIDACSGFREEVGTELCWSVHYPNATRFPDSPHFPLTGPAELKVALHKTDATLTSYQLRYKWERREDYRTFLISFNTPGTTVDREHSIKYNVNFRDKNVRMGFHSPKKVLESTGRYVWSNEEFRIDLSLLVDRLQSASLAAGWIWNQKASKQLITPIFTIIWQDKDLIKVTGDVEVHHKSNADLYEVDLGFEYPLFGGGQQGATRAQGSITGTITGTKSSKDINLDVSYRSSHREPMQQMKLEYLISNSSTSTDLKYDRRWRFFFSQFPNINFKGEWHYRHHYGSVENILQLNFGKNFESAEHRVDIFQGYTLYMSPESRNTFNVTGAIKHAKTNLDLKAGVDLFMDSRVINTGFHVQYATGKVLESRLHLTKVLSGFLKGSGEWIFNIPEFTKMSIKGNITETKRREYKYDVDAQLSENHWIEASGIYKDQSRHLETRHNLQLDLRLPYYGLTRTNTTFQADHRQITLVGQMMTDSGHKYRMRGTYIGTFDDLDAREHAVSIELHLPNQVFTANTELSIGNMVTVTTDLHLDSMRDVYLSVIADILQENRRGLQVQLKWDANRDPNQKLDIKSAYEDKGLMGSNLELETELGLLGHKYKARWDSIRKRTELDNKDIVWEQRHEGFFTWEDPELVKQKIAGGMNFRLRRGDTAEMSARIGITSPFENWENNFIEQKYVRDSDHIDTFIKARWHHDEYLNIQLLLQKQIDAEVFRIESKFDVSSSFEGLGGASTGISLKKITGLADTNFYIEWDTDRVEISIEVKDDSDDIRSHFIASGNVLTTMEGYRHLSSSVDLLLSGTSLSSHAVAKWDSDVYICKISGVVYSGNDYLKGDISISTPYTEVEQVLSHVRIYHNPIEKEDKILVTVGWGGELVVVEGIAATQPEHFKLGLTVKTPFVDFRNIAIALGYTRGTEFKTELKLKWNNIVNSGLVLVGHTTSLSDFLISATIITPIPNYDEIILEIRNLFRIQPEVRMHSRVYGQVGERKIGLGARYETGDENPRLRTSLELYTPLPKLRTVYFDILDNSSANHFIYDTVVLYGPTKRFRLKLDLENKEDYADFVCLGDLPFAQLSDRLDDTHLEASGRLSWNPETSLQIDVISNSSIETKASILARFPSPYEGLVNVDLATPFDGYEFAKVNINYDVRSDEDRGNELGFLTFELNSPIGGNYHGIIQGREGYYRGNYTTAISPFRKGEFEYELVARDILKSHTNMRLAWDEGEISINAVVEFEDDFIKVLDGTLATPWVGLKKTQINLLGEAEGGNYKNIIEVTGSEGKYLGNLLWTQTHKKDWELDVTFSKDFEGQDQFYQLSLRWRDQPNLSRIFKIELKTPHNGMKHVLLNFELQKNTVPYNFKLEWITMTLGEGDIDLKIQQLSFSDLDMSGEMNLHKNTDQFSRYNLVFQLINAFKRDWIDFSWNVDLISNRRQWDHMVLNGTIRQVTLEKPGELRLHMKWPETDPLTFRLYAYHENDFKIIRPSIELDFTASEYKFSGELIKKDDELNLKGVVEWRLQEAEKKKVEFIGKLLMNDNIIDGEAALHLPLGDKNPWKTSTASLKSSKKDGRNHFTVEINSGRHITEITGNMVAPDFPTAEGEIAVTSTMARSKLPIIVKFKQELTLEQYHGDYNIEYPVLISKKWIHKTVNVSLLHKYLQHGISGKLQFTAEFTKKIPVTFIYGFQFPSTGDMTIELGVMYSVLDLNIKSERVTVVFDDGVEKRKFSLEINNPLWPFGFSSATETKRISSSEYDKKTILTLYDLQKIERAISVTLNRNKDENGRLFTVEAQLPTRLLSFSTGYVFTHDQFGGSFIIGWSKDEKIEVILDWKDVSVGFMKEHVLHGRIAHPFRTVQLDGHYKRSSKDIDAKLDFNWDAADESASDEVVTGKFQWTDESNVGDRQYKLFAAFGHPKLEKDVSLRGEFRRTEEELLGGNLYLQYSPDSLNDLNMDMSIKREISDYGVVSFISDLSILHPSSNLTVACNGSLQVGGGIYGFKQRFLYVTEEGFPLTAHVDALVDTIEKKMHALLEGSKKVIDVRVTVTQEAGDRWLLEAVGRPEQKHPITSKLELHPKHPVFTLTIENIASWNNDTDFEYLLSEPRFLAERAVIQGGVEDLRNAKFIMKHQVPAWLLKKARGISEDDDIEETESEELVWVNDADFYFRLNHSRLLTSRLAWRTNIKNEFMSEVGELIGMSYDLRTDLRQWAIMAAQVAAKEAGKRTQPIILDLAGVARPLLLDFRNESKAFMEDLVLLYRSINSTAQELKMKETLSYIFEKIAGTLSNVTFIKNLRERGGGGGGVQLKAVMEKLQGLYGYLFSKDPNVPGIKEKLRSLLATFATVYDQFAKRFYLRATLVVQDFTSRVRGWLRSKWHAVFQNYKPHILVTFNMVETQTWQFVNRMMNTLKGIGFEIKSSSYYRKIVQLVSYFENIYNEITNNSIRQNLEKYHRLFWEKISVGIQESIDRVAPFVRDWTNELSAMWQKILRIPSIAILRGNYLAIRNRVVWAWNYLDVYGWTMDAAAFLLEHGYTIVSQTGVDAKQRHLKAKTDFKFNPEKGMISLVQKLPVDWNSFNDEPNWEDLPEYKVVRKFTGLFKKSNSTNTYLDLWYKYAHGHVLPSNWLPPFAATGYMIGEQHFITFDGKAIEFKGICQYILAADMVHESWAVTVKYHSNSKKTIKIYVDGKEIEIELDYRVKVDGRPIELPINLKTSSLTRTLSRVELTTDTGLTFSWNMEHDVIAISVTGYYFYKTGGLLGLYNNEPSDDYQIPGGDSHGHSTLADSANNLARSWTVSQECQDSGNIANLQSKVPVTHCTELFISVNSPLKHCFYTIDPLPYLKMCLVDHRSSAKDTCQVATAYTEACMNKGIPIKIPVFCTQCTYETNSRTVKKLEEGKSIMLSQNEVLKSTDVVILLEARACNKEFSLKKRLHKFISVFNDQLSKDGFPLTRFAVIAFGGRGVFREPTYVTVDNKIFTDASSLHRAIDHIEFSEEIGGLPADAFGAMTFAAGNTDFRPAVSVTFLHFPCTACDPRYMMVSYSDMYHILLETSVTLHVFTPGHFNIAKENVRKKLFGMDRETAYTIKDARGPLRGDPVLRRQLNAPKDDLGYCAALSIETNGTIFAAEQMKSNKKKQVEKMAIVVGRVVASKAVPQEDQHCECLSTMDGAPIMKCISWDFGPLSIMEDFGYDSDIYGSYDSNFDEDGMCEERNEEGLCVSFSNM